MSDTSRLDQNVGLGYRLHKLEIFNWGTFDSSEGNIHTVRPQGATTLLIGQNGSGKSTLVDALLTLLVKPATRNYNVAAGANKRERNERTYIKGAYGRLGRDEDNRADMQYLRPSGNQYAALLACFRNDRGEAITVAQVLYLKSGGDVGKIYCFATDEKSIVTDCANLKTERMQQQLKERGFRTTTSYIDYHSWFMRATNIREKAMDVFNQTVAVKDIHRLNDFIRTHMLEEKPWDEKIDSLQTHFSDLSKAYLSLVDVRRRHDSLVPIEEKGRALMVEIQKLQNMDRVLAASDSFFKQKTIDLLEPCCTQAEANLIRLGKEKNRLEGESADLREDERRTRNEMELAGGERLKNIPQQIKLAEVQRDAKRVDNLRFHQYLQTAGLREPITSQEAMASLHARLPKLLDDVDQQIVAFEKIREDKAIDRAAVRRQREDAQRELTSLEQHQGNLPEALADLRRRMREHLGLPESALVFAAELISVKPESRDWESSIEMVLRNFGLSLLVPQQHYPMVSRYVDQNRLADRQGRGQRLVYLKVGARASVPQSRDPMHPGSLIQKLTFKDGHSLLPWVKAELEERLNYICCETIDEFQQISGLALTKERQVKYRGARHEKDDREQATDRSRFVLGWDNRAKQRYLTDRIVQLDKSIQSFNGEITRLDTVLTSHRERKDAFGQLRKTANYSEIDYAIYERELSSLREEKELLEQNNEALRLLKKRLEITQAKDTAVRLARDGVVEQEGKVKESLVNWRETIRKARGILQQREHAGELATHMQSFAECEAFFAETPLTAERLDDEKNAYDQARHKERDALKGAIDPQMLEVSQLMNNYLRDFPDEKADLGADLSYIESFCARAERIRCEALPQYELRFKERLNEKVTQEIGILNGTFQAEMAEIRDKIDLLNLSLRQLEYRPGTYMQLAQQLVRDVEITDFQISLRECLADAFEGTIEADEARYVRIEKLLKRLQEDNRWRDKVTDVRKWFDFAARETEEETGRIKADYTDSDGQSGGEKAKLAFTILVAAIAYQYDVDPGRPASNHFQFVVVDEMFSKVDDQYSEYALELFRKFGLQLLIVAPLDAKARVTEPYVGCYLHVVKDLSSHRSVIYSMTASEFEEATLS